MGPLPLCQRQSLSTLQNFLGVMAYNRLWFNKDRFAITVGGGAITNPGRYLVLTPPINGATAASTSPSFTQGPGDAFRAWDSTITFSFMPKQFITYLLEFDHRQANVPYFSGAGGITPAGGNQGLPGSAVPGFTPDLQKTENRINASLMVRL